jgi:preprotein translocase subunit SecG
MVVISIIAKVFVVIASILLILLILLHKASGGGLSDMFGGGISSAVGSSGVAEKNLNRLTIVIAIIWTAAIIILGLIGYEAPEDETATDGTETSQESGTDGTEIPSLEDLQNQLGDLTGGLTGDESTDGSTDGSTEDGSTE